jgi:hypothetical protein
MAVQLVQLGEPHALGWLAGTHRPLTQHAPVPHVPMPVPLHCGLHAPPPMTAAHWSVAVHAAHCAPTAPHAVPPVPDWQLPEFKPVEQHPLQRLEPPQVDTHFPVTVSHASPAPQFSAIVQPGGPVSPPSMPSDSPVSMAPVELSRGPVELSRGDVRESGELPVSRVPPSGVTATTVSEDASTGTVASVHVSHEPASLSPQPACVHAMANASPAAAARHARPPREILKMERPTSKRLPRSARPCSCPTGPQTRDQSVPASPAAPPQMSVAM